MRKKVKRRIVMLFFLGVFAIAPSIVHAGNGANFVLYNHHTAEAGEMEVMLMNDFGQEADGTRYTAQMVEFELGVTERFTTEFMIEGQTTEGSDSYLLTGFRLEGRYRLFDYGTFLNPVIYVEYEDLSEETKYVMEMAGREDATPQNKARPSRERVLETRFIIGHDFREGFDISANWLNESDLDTGVTSFGYAIGLNYVIPGFTDSAHMEDEEKGYKKVTFGLELFGALGDSDKGITADSDITQHYLSPNFKVHMGDNLMVKLGGAIGLTNVSQDIVRLAMGYEF